MHSTSFVLGKGVGCLRSVFCVLVSNIDRLLAREWCLLSAAFAVNTRHRTAAFTASHMLRRSSRPTRPPKLQVDPGKIAKSSGDSAAVPRTKGKEFFSRVTQWRWRSCEPQNDNRSHQLCGLRRSTCRWCRRAATETSGCMHVWRPRFATPRGLFWLAFDWCKQVKQVARSPWQLWIAEGKSTRLNEHQRSRDRQPKSKKKVSLPSCSRSGLQRLRMLAFFFFWIFARISGAGWTFWEPFLLLFAVSVAQRSESIVCILSIAVWRGAFCLRSWPKTKFGEEMTGSQWRSSSWSEESWPEVCAHDDGIFLWWIVRRACENASQRCALWKKKNSDEQRKKEECSQSKRSTCKNRACKIFAPKWQQKIVCSVIALLAMKGKNILGFPFSERRLHKHCDRGRSNSSCEGEM